LARDRTSEIEKQEEKSWGGKKETRDCYTCGAVGHVSRDCTKKAKKN
jgi:hypothetical protein